MQTYTFLVHETPYCAWGENLSEDNKEFIDRLDPDYFSYIADIGEADSQGEDKQRSFILLRAAYTQGIETLFSLLFSSIQAPNYIPGWMLKYQDKDLRALVKKLINGERIEHLLNVEKLDLIALCKIIHGLDSTEDLTALSESFAKSWKMFADDLLDKDKQSEYNSIKHGLRTSGSPFVLVMAPNDSNGNPISESAIKSDSDFSTSFFIAENIDKNNIYLRKNYHSWEIEYLIESLRIINLSIMNIINYINIQNEYPYSGTIVAPEKGVSFRLTRNKKASFHNFKIKPMINIHNTKLLTKEKIVEQYKSKQRPKQ